jgi:hypothetical protein
MVKKIIIITQVNSSVPFKPSTHSHAMITNQKNIQAPVPSKLR